MDMFGTDNGNIVIHKKPRISLKGTLYNAYMSVETIKNWQITNNCLLFKNTVAFKT